jgi:hypothetical protein
MVKYFLAPNPRWQGRDATGEPLVGGSVTTYAAGSVIPKATYQDAAGTNPNTNPVILDGKGEANIYWANDNLYFIEVRDALGNMIETQDNYPTVDCESPINTTNFQAINLARNPQFSYWSNSVDYPGVTQSANNSDFITDDWLFFRNNTNATIQLRRQTFSLGQSVVPSNPIYYFEYICSNAGAGGETYKWLGQRYNSIQSLSGQTVTVAFWAKASANNTALSCVFTQSAGTGGSPSPDVDTLAVTANLSTSWAQYSGTVTIPALPSSTSLGTNGDDALILKMNFPLNSTVTIDIANLQFQLPASSGAFPYTSFNDQFKRLDNRVTYAVWQTGDVKTTFRNAANQPDPGWLYMDDTNIGNPASGATHAGLFTKALYTLLWNNVSDTYAPVSTGRGANAEADYNANKTLTLTKTLGRVLACIGIPSAGGSGTNWAAGQTFGEENHTLTIAEMPAHTHPGSVWSYIAFNAAGGGTPVYERPGVPTDNQAVTVASQGGGGSHNTVQPTVHLSVMIKL